MRFWIAGASLVLASLAQAEGSRMTYKGYDTPEYRLERHDGAFELRDYAPHLVAEVTTTGGPRAAVSAGFRALAGYIFGKNATGEKIAMTAPVTQTPAGDAWVIRFMIPPGRSVDDLPAAARSDIRLVEEPGGRYLVYRFSGFSSPGRMQAAEAKLAAFANAQSYRPTGPAQWLYYDDPMTLPFRRRNEVALPVD